MNAAEQRIELAVAQTQARQAVEDAVAREVLADPLPGPLKDVFAPQQDIEVGPYKVRPFVDRDVEYLVALEHPAIMMWPKEATGKEPTGQPFFPRGWPAWTLAWVFTHPFKEVKKVFTDGGSKHVLRLAEDEFGEFQIGALAELCRAVSEQMQRYWAPVIAYEPAEEPKLESEEGGPEAKPRAPFG